MMILNFVKFKKPSKTEKNEQNCCRPTCRCHHLGYSVPPALHRTIRCRSTFGPRGPGLSNPTSFPRPALSMAPTRDDNARDKRSVRSNILKIFCALYDDEIRCYKKNVSKSCSLFDRINCYQILLLLSNTINYRKFHSTETTLLKLTNDIFENIDFGKITILTALDMSVAFDTLDHATLIHRLKHIHLVSLVLSSPGFSHICFLAHFLLTLIRPHLPLPTYSQAYLGALIWVHFFLFFLSHQMQTSYILARSVTIWFLSISMLTTPNVILVQTHLRFYLRLLPSNLAP